MEVAVIVKEAFERKISLLTKKLNTELRKKLARYYIWNIVWLRDLDTKKDMESFKM